MFFNILACNSSVVCLLEIVKLILKIFMFALPIILIVLGVMDLFKAMITSDEKAAKESRKMFLRRVVYTIIVFLVPTIVMALFNILPSSAYDNDINGTNWYDCWNEA